MKHVVLIMDGASGWPHARFAGRTSLEVARTPHLDLLAREGTVGLAHTVPTGMEPSSAVACMSVMGFDPVRYFAGRGPIEAMALGIDLGPDEVALRCNLVTVLEGVMRSYASGHISSAESHRLVETLQEHLGDDRVRFHPGLGFRQILTVRDGEALLRIHYTPPHDIADQPVAAYLPQPATAATDVSPAREEGRDDVGDKAEAASWLLNLMERSREVLVEHPVNRARMERGDLPANLIWPFWPGLKPGSMPSFVDVYGHRAALTSGVDLLRGLARQAGLDYLDIPGVTDGGDTDYTSQITGAIAALSDHDVVLVHVEAPDEAAHTGDAEGKVRAIEMIDAFMVPAIAALPDTRLLAMPDHPTPLQAKTHVNEPVPFLMWGPGIRGNGAVAFTERQAEQTGLTVAPGHLLMGRFLSSVH